ncbi:MAG TPA: hypothetical protein DCL43_13065 [Chitinophagaceae bacterium]|nr:hypothetical protein [Chitinophagaceae bacterium]HAN39486.1 hypothetical protein [Chitinophagaceae bacterium]
MQAQLLEQHLLTLKQGHLITLTSTLGTISACLESTLAHLTVNDTHQLYTCVISDERTILQYITNPDLAAFDWLALQHKPTALVYNDFLLDTNVNIKALGVWLPDNDDALRYIAKRLREPIFIFHHSEDELHTIIPTLQYVQWNNGEAALHLP